MTGAGAAAIIAAAATVITALGGLALALAVLLPSLRKNRDAVAAVHSEVREVHTIVNQQRSDAMAYQAALVAALTAAGVPVPTDVSLAPHPPTEG